MGEPKRLTTDATWLWGLCWTADSQEIIFSSPAVTPPCGESLLVAAHPSGCPIRVAAMCCSPFPAPTAGV